MDIHKFDGKDAQNQDIHILVVDDERSLLDVLTNILETSSMVVIPAQTAQEAYQKLKEHTPHLILLDVMLPDENGLNLCRRIKSNRATKDIPVIVLSVRASEQDKIAGFEVGADDYITKPFNSSELKARIKSVLRSYKERRPAH